MYVDNVMNLGNKDYFLLEIYQMFVEDFIRYI